MIYNCKWRFFEKKTQLVCLVCCQYSGGSAAESSVFQVLDAALGILHSKDTGKKLLRFN